ncbi:hypothetical protein [uncultured Fibrella sp.]|uniref:hypothetical protein n=1 Tax=uncultured Fibrella sp. TaxID=1284596 RepID=UPI0035CC0F8C
MKTRLNLLFFVLLTLPALAQTPQRTDFTALLSQMPPLPGNAQSALAFSQQPSPYLPYSDKLRSILDAIQQPNPVSQRAVQKGMAMDAQFKADGVDKMTDAQKIAYARQKNLGGPGSDNRLAFAEQMKDPAFQKRFQAMSTQEKMALMQQQGVLAKPAAVPQTSNPMQADMVAMMQDPAMREKWKNMSQAERQAFIEQQKKAKGYDTSRRPSAPTSDTSGSFADMIDGPSTAASGTPVMNAIDAVDALQTALTNLAKSTQTLAEQQLQQANQRQAAMQRTLTEAEKVQQAEGMAEAKRQGKSGQNWVLTNPAADRQIRVNAGTEQQKADNLTLSTAHSQWTQQQGVLRQAIATYQKAMTAINYGESLYADDTQFKNLTTLAGKQAAALSALQSIADSFSKVALLSATNQTNLINNSQPVSSPRQLMQGDGG